MSTTSTQTAGSGIIALRATRGIKAAVLALAVAALPALAQAEDTWNPQEQARVEQFIAQAIQGNGNPNQQMAGTTVHPGRQPARHAAQATRPVGMSAATFPQVH